MIRDFMPDPLPMGCPFSFVSQLERDPDSRQSTKAMLGALRYDTCDLPSASKPQDATERDIKDWFAFTLDKKTCGLWGYFDHASYNFKITAGGKKVSKNDAGDEEIEGKDQALLEMWNEEGFGITQYVNQGDTGDLPHGDGQSQAGFYYYSSGAADYFQLFIKDNESSFWGYAKSNWQYKITAADTSTIFQMWKGDTGSDDQPPAGYAKIYVTDNGAGFSCSKSDTEASTLSHYDLFIKSSSGKYSQYYAGGLYMGSNSDTNTYIDMQVINGVSISFKQVSICVDGEAKTAWVLMSDPS